MGVSNMKNIVVLKNLPSNLIEEAIVIIKTNKYAKRLEHIEKNAKTNSIENKNSKDYIIREAESVISNYISKVEKNKKENIPIKNIEKKYKKLKLYSICVSVIIFLNFISYIF